MKKRTVLVFALILFVAFAFTSCGGKGETATAAGAEEGGVRSYDMFIRSQYHDWIKELKWYDVAEERTGIHVNYIDGPLEIADTYTEVDQRLASRTLPDAAMLRLSQAKVYGAQGAFVDLAPYIKEYAPNIQAYIDTHPEYKSFISDDQGRIFAFVREKTIIIDFMGYRADQFREAGIDPASVRTVDDFTNALRTLKAYFGKTNPNYYPLSGRESALRFAYLWGAAAYVDENSSGGMGDASIFYDYYNRAEWFMSNGGPEVDPDYDMQVLDMLVDENGNPIKAPTSTLYENDNAIAVNISCDEETIITICEFMDYFFSEEGIILANWGVEGESFKTNEDGSRCLLCMEHSADCRGCRENRPG